MFKEFWERKKGLIECTAFLVAVGALFLNIPLPDVETARISLLKVQLMWLFLITVSVGVLAVYFYIFALDVVHRIKERISLDMTVASTFFLLLGFYMLWHLWWYMVILYEAEWKWFSETILRFLFAGYFIFGMYTIRSLERRVPRFHTFILYSVGACILFAALASSYISLTTLDFSFSEWRRFFFNYLGLNTILFAIFMTYRYIRKRMVRISS